MVITEGQGITRQYLSVFAATGCIAAFGVAMLNGIVLIRTVTF